MIDAKVTGISASIRQGHLEITASVHRAGESDAVSVLVKRYIKKSDMPTAGDVVWALRKIAQNIEEIAS